MKTGINIQIFNGIMKGLRQEEINRFGLPSTHRISHKNAAIMEARIRSNWDARKRRTNKVQTLTVDQLYQSSLVTNQRSRMRTVSIIFSIYQSGNPYPSFIRNLKEDPIILIALNSRLRKNFVYPVQIVLPYSNQATCQRRKWGRRVTTEEPPLLLNSVLLGDLPRQVNTLMVCNYTI